jgi:hypothetical protein
MATKQLDLLVYMQIIINRFLVLILGLVSTVYCAGLWWRDVIREGMLEGEHTQVVQRGLCIGMILFIISEVMFFLHFFGHIFIQVWRLL